MAQTIWIARHGNRIDFVRPEWFDTAERPYDPHLSPDGEIQARELGDRLQGEGITHIFASPFLRTVQTANYVADILDLPIKLEWGLCEWLNPGWMKEMPETLPPETLKKQFSRIDLSYRSVVQPQYPETDKLCQQRTAKTARLLVENYSTDLLWIGHGASVVGAAIGLLGESREIKASLCCLVKLAHRNSRWAMELNGDTSHLSQSETIVRLN
ncbi:histidine phosphatase family protein [Oscillatoriales cyanobacterium LEGE 11467]|uniref:Histidine phosphatase family protein n=1 Tax=Zarconia navalis LEGE 11467 TaxID=1828826 RepID=A0A928VV60_9CYAN|nr:histidine phosphatase family protein [Zarconia navalis]MBE9040827.1 histidine phosphatase family protein [Zarconia navalis LEGE 11467]